MGKLRHGAVKSLLTIVSKRQSRFNPSPCGCGVLDHDLVPTVVLVSYRVILRIPSIPHVLSRVWLFATPWTAATRLLCPWDSPASILEWVAISSSRGSSQSREWTQVSCIKCGSCIPWAIGEHVLRIICNKACKTLSTKTSLETL